jgi:DNA-binding NarL/FixJ family response regulator
LTREELARQVLLLLGLEPSGDVDVAGQSEWHDERGANQLAEQVPTERDGVTGVTGVTGVGLTRAQIRVMELLDEGMRPKEIARMLNTSVSTVRKHISNAAAALGARGALAATSAFRRLVRAHDDRP